MKFLIYQSQLKKEFYFRFLNNNGRQFMRSNSYTSEEGAEKGIGTFKELAGNKSNFNIDKTDKGNIMFELKAKNNMTVATSIVFESQTAVKEALRYITSNAKSASIEYQRPIP